MAGGQNRGVARRLAPLALALLALAGCGGSGGGAVVPSIAPAEASALVSAEAKARGTASADAVDACGLLSPAEVAPLIGKDVPGQPSAAGGDGGVCRWENPDDYRSVSVDIGGSGTAANGTLPTWDPAQGPERPLPDGMRALGGGQVEFVAGTRDCTVQVASTITGDADENTAVELARDVRGRL
jgi:hypothetical protein